MSITPLPSPPEPTDSTSQFNTKAFAWVAALDNFTTEANALTANVNALEDSTIVFAGQAQTSASQSAASATASANSATTALGHASAAAANTNAPLWVSGTTYAAGALVYSALDGRTYRRKTAGAGTTNPVSDSTNWTPLLLEVATLRPTIRPSLLLDFANTKRLDSRVTFTRASTATYYGTQTAKAEENLLTYSQEFNQAIWEKFASTITANTETAPDGTATAETWTISATTAQHYIQQVSTYTSGLQYTISVFVKKNTLDFIQLVLTGGRFSTNAYANFDINTGVLGTVGADATATITSAGSGWYRCSVTGTATSTGGGSSFFAFIASASDARLPSYAGNGTDSVFLWQAQLEQRSSVTAPVLTTTQPITNYIPVLQTALAGVPRFDHNPTTFESLGLLVEEQRSNALTYSEDFSNAAWTKTRTSITSNTIVAPDGTLTGDKLVEDTTATSSHVVQQVYSFTSGTSYSASIYVKAAERTRIRFGAANTTTYAAAAFFDLSAGTVISIAVGSASIQPVGNGWYRCIVAGVAGATSATNLAVTLVSTGTTESYTGNGYSGIYIWGAQLEAGAFPTSYIPTVASQVTRSADAASMTGANFSSWYRADEGSFYIDFADVKNTAASLFALDDGTTSQRILNILNGSTTQAAFRVVNGGVDQANFSPSSFTALSNVKYASAYKVNDFAAVTNGGTVATDTSGTIPVVTAARIGQNVAGGSQINGYIKRLTFYPLRCTNTQLQALTSV